MARHLVRSTDDFRRQFLEYRAKWRAARTWQDRRAAMKSLDVVLDRFNVWRTSQDLERLLEE